MDILTFLETTPPARWAQETLWAFPMLEILHLTGLTVVFGGMVMIDLRLLGLRREWSARMVQHYILPFVWGGFAVAAFAGLWLFIEEANKAAHDTPFLIKVLVLLPLAGLNALYMHFIAQKDIDRWDTGAAPPPLVRLSALVSLCLWVGILACGRLIAYYYPFPY